MCKEDVRLARAAAPGKVYLGDPAGTLTKMLDGNHERYSLSLAFQNQVSNAATFAFVAYARVGDQLYPVLGISADHPMDRCTLYDVGQLIQAEIWGLFVDSDTDAGVYCAETRWNQPQETI